MTSTLDFLTEAVNRELSGDDSGTSWVWHQQMSSDDHLKFDGFLVRTKDELAFQAGTPYSRFRERVRRMVEATKQRLVLAR